MRVTKLYPELRRSLTEYDVEELVARLPELLAYGEPITVTDTGQQPWVLVPAEFYDTLIAAWAGLNSWIEARRQQSEPLPKL
ncbi:hypothetical protein MGAD_14180 [Mycolicibacterium gadium]|uniref:Antitoxin n=2 Tax=Mycolicibacterium gadium TaxID=1794 RepID=A0A7I7WKQ0_MYCGU|nr:hypothetical protein MGAD_14180 [Mycolicibacterium gadium]